MKKEKSTETEEKETVDPMLVRAIGQVTELWHDCQKKFIGAMKDSEKLRINVNFCVTLDTSENIPIVDTEISFRDKDHEGGMSVTKVFRKSISGELEDPNQMTMPLNTGTPSRLFDAPEGQLEAKEEESSQTFSVSDVVTWTSNGKEKIGNVLEVVQKNFLPSEENQPKDCGKKTRDHESYIVNIPSPSGKGRGTNCWPIVSKLSLAETA